MVMELLDSTLDKYLVQKYGKNKKNLPNIPLDIHLLIMK